MSNLLYTKGNLLELARAGKFDVIVHGANCFNTMGAGIALQIKNKYPDAYYVADCGYSYAGDYNKLGNYSVMVGKPFSIINAYTQYGTNSNVDKTDLFEYASFAVILQKLAHEYHGCNFGFPYIGMGLAGGDKESIIALLENFATKVHETDGTVTLVEYAQ